jgi:hypothetical protein
MVENQGKNTYEVSSVPFFHRVIDELRPFLGAQAEGFVRRQCTHIRISPEDLSREHISSLSNWMYTSAKLIMTREKAEQLRQKIMLLEK